MKFSRRPRLPALLTALALALSAQSATAFDLDRWLPVDPLLAQWWQLYASVPTNVRDDLGDSPDACGLGQNGAVWYLTSDGTFNKKITQHCTVPKGKVLMVPILVAICVPFLDETVAANIQFCRELIDPFEKLTLEINGVKRNKLIDRHAQSKVFPVSFAENNVFDSDEENVPAGLYKAVAEGFYALLELPVGHHKVHTRADSGDPEIGYFDVTYYIDVVAPTSVVPE